MGQIGKPVESSKLHIQNFDEMNGKLKIIRDVSGCSTEGTIVGITPGLMPQLHVTNCRQINYQNANKYPLEVEAWEVGDRVYHMHHIISIDDSNICERSK